MSQQILFVHGGGPGSYEADRILADRLQADLGSNVDVLCPQLPDEGEPDYLKWKAFLLPILTQGPTDLIAVGHSIGGSVLAKLFVEERVAARAMVLVSAPFWRNEGFWCWDEVVLPPDSDRRLPPKVAVLLYHGTADATVPVGHLADYKHAFPRAQCVALPGKDHQLGNDMAEVAAGIRKLCPDRTW